ncbi:hypothetical protein [Deinococcus aquaedulcis]|uniref:hypothetical protein n=1 Tax=Deinococcus aquaedulcis TaxID=2840455 RepID=UPI001C83DC06|nr:hypothetical protein [Deinococcus aquaedulcis]
MTLHHLRHAALITLGALTLSTLAPAHASCFLFICSLEATGSLATNGQVDALYREVLGRPSSLQERSLWAARGYRDDNLSAAQENQVRAELTRNLHAPGAAAILTDLTRRVFFDAMGGTPHPNNPFFKLLGKLAQKPESTYSSLLAFTRTYLQDPQIDGAREGLIRAAFMRSLGRTASTADLTYWQANIKANGTTYQEVMRAAQDWVLAAGNEAEFAALIRRAFKAAGRAEPTNTQIVQIRLANQNTRRTFDGWKTFIQKF